MARRGRAPARPQRTRAATTWIGLGIATLLLIGLIVFIAQNNRQVPLSFFSASGSVSLALALLVAAVGGAVVTLLAGSIRILQLRRQVRRTATEAYPDTAAATSGATAQPAAPATPTAPVTRA